MSTRTSERRRIRIGIKPGQWGWTFGELSAAWDRAEALGFDVLACFDHVTALPANLAAWDAPTLLAVMAARTKRIALSVDVLNVSLRHPFLLAAQLAVVQAASGGRLEVGLGAGSFELARHDHRALGIRMPPLAERRALLDACVRVYPALWRGERVSDETLGLRDASLGPIAIAIPPLVLGGTSEAIMEAAVRGADGWNTHLRKLDEYEDRARAIADISQRYGRTRPLLRHVQVFADSLEPEAARELVDGAETLGATTVMFVLHRNHDLGAMEQLARAVLR